jgi:carbonic anhydrase
VEGRQYPLEIHFVHVNSKYADITAALESGNSDALLVVGQMFKVGETESDALKAMASKMSSAVSSETPMKASDMIDACESQHPQPAVMFETKKNVELIFSTSQIRY